MGRHVTQEDSVGKGTLACRCGNHHNHSRHMVRLNFFFAISTVIQRTQEVWIPTKLPWRERDLPPLLRGLMLCPLKAINVVVVILNGLIVAMCGLLYYGSIIIQPGDGGQPATAHLDGVVGIWGACLLAYCLICFVTAFAKRKGPGVLTAGIVAHMFLAAFVVLPFTDRHNGFGIFLFDCIFAAIYGALWWRMYSGLGPVEVAPAVPNLSG